MNSFRNWNSPRSKRLQFKRRAATIVEFALVIPFLLAILLGILEFAWLARSHLTLANAAREGARAASLGRSTTDIRNRVRSAATVLSGVNDNSRFVVNLARDDGDASNGYNYNVALGDSGTSNNAPAGSMIQVQVAYQHRGLTGFIPFLNRQITLNVVMRREA